MTKKEMSIEIASALLNASVDETNWKVQDLMKRTKSELESHMRLADRINMKKMCKDCKQMYVPVLDIDDDTCPSCARF